MAGTEGSGSRQIFPPTVQADVELTQGNPVSGTLYTVLATTQNVRICSIEVDVTWTVQPSPLQVWITVDGQTIQLTFTNPVSATPYYFYQWNGSTTDVHTLSTTASHHSYVIEGKSVRVQAETTGGTTSQLHCRVKYARW